MLGQMPCANVRYSKKFSRVYGVLESPLACLVVVMRGADYAIADTVIARGSASMTGNTSSWACSPHRAPAHRAFQASGVKRRPDLGKALHKDGVTHDACKAVFFAGFVPTQLQQCASHRQGQAEHPRNAQISPRHCASAKPTPNPVSSIIGNSAPARLPCVQRTSRQAKTAARGQPSAASC